MGTPADRSACHRSPGVWVSDVHRAASVTRLDSVARTGYRLRMTRGQRGRANANLELAGTTFLIVASVVVWVARPGFMGPTPWWEVWLPPVGLAGMLIGLALMFRIYRAVPEPDQQAWRYRERV